MAAPTIQKTWTITANNSIAFVSLNDTMGNYLKGMADFLLAHGYTCKGSCDGVTGAMDGVNRWTTVLKASVRGATTSTAQSWMVVTDANACDICLAYQGASDDIARFAFSPGGLYVVAGTTTFTPTATDEAVIMTGVTVINATASSDRVWAGWVDSASKLCRFLINRAAVTITAWGVELLNTRASMTQTFSPAVWGFGFSGANFFYTGATAFLANYSANVRGGLIRVMGANIGLGGGAPFFLSAGVWGNVQTELQGSVGYPMWGPLSVGSSNASRQGVVADTYDWWSGRNGGASSNVGDTYFTKTFVQFGGSDGLVWPWDGSTPNVGTGGASAAQNGYAQANSPAESYGQPTSGNTMYVPLARSAVTPTGPSAIKTLARRPGIQVVRLQALSADPAAESGKVLLYTRTISGQQVLFCRLPDGTVYQVGAG